MHNKQSRNHSIRVRLLDDTFKIVTKVGLVYLTNHIILYNVLLIPKFQHNLLLVHKLLTTSKLVASFSSSSYSFQDLAIANAKDGSYVLKFKSCFANVSNIKLCSNFHVNVNYKVVILLVEINLFHSKYFIIVWVILLLAS